ncbi:transcriptional protein SWT1-like [Homarus americanus]|uniref:Transcriptional protein SWT1-like n=1 Tax=Homarus americanus TaxID=6706 RepID=A0A8J5JGB3_HOMAM|nr:transcriptional protein SWT1-like [Homarus americanus]XP_042204834.1 transcriptional protein SWT1-like [Homarus americanus]KAG7155906.1 Transcriptional protein SWT1-like [Homarus americanus]
MAEGDNGTVLPRDWVLKSSRRCPVAKYYFNTKTGQATWIHPLLLKESKEDCSKEPKELKKSPKKRKKVKINLSESQGSIVNELIVKSDEAEVTSTNSVAVSSHSPHRNNPVQGSPTVTESDDGKAIDEEKWNSRKPVKFAFKAKTEPKKDSLSGQKKIVSIHPSLLRARKVAEKLQWSKKVKDKKVKPQSERTVPSIKLEEKVDVPDNKLKESVEKTRKGKITAVSTRRIVKAKRRIEYDKKVKEDEASIQEIIEEISGSPCKKNEECKVKSKEEKVHYKHNKNNEYDVYKHFVKSKQVSHQTLKSSHKDNYPPEESELPPLDKVVHKQEPHYEVDTENDSDEVTEMEVEEQEIITEIANFRGSVSHSHKTDSNQLLTTNINSNSESVCIVVDTNILIQDIGFLESLKSKEIAKKEVVIVIPYTALKEMDGLKKNASIGKASQAAICWCNSHFENNDPRVQGQSYDNYLKTLAHSQHPSGDDLIRDCCLLLKKESLDVCLLTNDVNLRNKALMSAITAVSIRGLRLKLKENASNQMTHSVTLQDTKKKITNHSLPDVDNIYNYCGNTKEYPQLDNMVCEVTPKCLSSRQEDRPRYVKKLRKSSGNCESKDETLLHKISTSLRVTLSQILECIMKDTYGDLWLQIVKCKPPWSISDVFSCWEKHWIAIMSDKFPREVKILMKQIQAILGDCKRGRGNIDNLSGQVQNLYLFFKSQPYQSFISPIHGQTDENTDMSEIPIQGSVLPSSDSLIDVDKVESSLNEREDSNRQQPTPSGLENLEKMINLVGAHITHFIALVLEAYGVEHSLPTLNTSGKMTREGARSSGINLHKVTMKLGTTIFRCLSEGTSESLQEFGHLLINFWADAKQQCPNLPFTEEDLTQVVTAPSGRNFLQLTLGELERLLAMLVAVNENQ